MLLMLLRPLLLLLLLMLPTTNVDGVQNRGNVRHLKFCIFAAPRSQHCACIQANMRWAFCV